MTFEIDHSLVEFVRLLPEQMQEARGAFSRSVKNGGLEPRLLELARLRSAGINGCRF
jgi:alkylhydroperoxidase family enzyme